MSEYTSTTQTVKNHYAGIRVAGGASYEIADAEFDRWLAQHDAEVRRDQIEKDAAIAHSHIGGFGVSLFAENYTAKQVETAIRAQLEGSTDA